MDAKLPAITQAASRRWVGEHIECYATFKRTPDHSDMKLSEILSPAAVRAPEWETYNNCADAIGFILDNKFEDPHVVVYEHLRHTLSEVFKHTQGDSAPPAQAPDADDPLAEEEQEFLSCLQVAEECRRINIIGHVGAGKTTFMKHLMALHFKTEQFGRILPIYIDHSDFNASLDDPMVEIRRKFCNAVWAALEKLFGRDEMRIIDDRVFKNAEMFAMSRAIADRHGGKKRQAYVRDEIDRAIKDSADSVRFTIARLNALSEGNANRMIIIVDNIDHLHQDILRRLFEFLVEIQIAAAPMLVVCMRDHTDMTWMSSFGTSRTVPTWQMSLNPPNLGRMLELRIRHFFGDGNPDDRTGKIGNKMRFGVEKSKICRALLKSPFRNPETYEFICNYTNYNLRDLFANLQRIVGFHGHSSQESILVLQDEPVFTIGIDECLISLALGGSLVFFPGRSLIFNPYSAGNDAHERDRIVACRILQLLDNRQQWTPYSEVKRLFSAWGYGTNAVEAQIAAMINKDLVWTSTGDPANFREESQIRLSYRGQLYTRKIMGRAVYNYMMSFDVNAPEDNHPVLRRYKSEIETELESFSDFSANFNSETLADRVLGLAEILFAEEQEEVRHLTRAGEISNFKMKVSPRSVSVGIVIGLSKFLNRLYQEDETRRSRFQPPSTNILKEVGEAIERYKAPFADTFRIAG
jgi:GTPase SAR1 family protein